MNLSMLAKLCGVSAATVSKAFSGSGEISEETRNKIFEIAKEHGVYDRYNKNKYDKKVIAVLCPELNSDYYNNFVTILDKEITAHGGIMTVSVTNFDEEREKTLVSYYCSYCKADGIITINQKADVNEFLNIPIVAIGPSQSANVKERITYTNVLGDVVGYLKKNGHTDIGFVGELLTVSKINAFKESLRHHLLPLNEKYIRTSDLRFEDAGIEVMDKWFESGEVLPTAIVAAYDYIAIGIIKSITRHGLKVPDDISVVGMDGINIGNYLETTLSSISNNSVLCCRKASEIIMKKIKDPLYREDVEIPSEFIVRASSGRVKRK